MSKFAAWLPVGDGTKDRGEEARAIKCGKKGIKIKKGFKTLLEIPLSEIVSVDAWREQSCTKGKRVLGGAVAGSLLFGAVGALVGAAAADPFDWHGEIVTRTGKVTFRFSYGADSRSFLQWWGKIKTAFCE